MNHWLPLDSQISQIGALLSELVFEPICLRLRAPLAGLLWALADRTGALTVLCDLAVLAFLTEFKSDHY